jgi:GntR family transcriptional regulator, rspAB operon transcriptional repressor
MRVTPSKNTSSAEVIRELRRQIILNELPPGTVLTELGLGSSLGCSQAAVREVLLRLEGEGLVSREGRKGTMVTDLDASAAAEILDLRRRIETRAARAVVRRVGKGDLAELEAIYQEMLEAASAHHLWGVVEHDLAFHEAIFKITGLQAMKPILTRCILHTQRFKLWAPHHQRSLHQTAERHLPILKTIRARDASGLQRELGIHLDTIVEEPPSSPLKELA